MRVFGKPIFRMTGAILIGWNAWSPTPVSSAEPSAPSPPPDAVGATLRGNPLWVIPVENLAATRERPIFSLSRRPPPPATVAPPAPPPPAPSAPPQPPLELIGTILNGRDGYGIFRDQGSDTVVKLKTGEIHEGWVLSSIGTRDAMLQRDHNRVVLALPARDSEQNGTPDASGAKPTAAVPSASAQTKPSQDLPTPIFYPEH